MTLRQAELAMLGLPSPAKESRWDLEGYGKPVKSFSLNWGEQGIEWEGDEGLSEERSLASSSFAQSTIICWKQSHKALSQIW